MHAATLVDAASSRFKRISPTGEVVWRTLFFGPSPSSTDSSSLSDADATEFQPSRSEGEISPQAFLIEQSGGRIRAHFHYVDQFQVFVAGSGTLGAHPVAPLTVQFAAARTGYGPIESDHGVSYFTFRAQPDETGAQYLPEARPRMGAGRRRSLVVPRIALDGVGAKRSLESLELLTRESDALAVFVARIPPGSPIQLPDFQGSNGVSVLVASGSVDIDSRSYPSWSCLYLDPETQAFVGWAGSDGAELIFMRYPQSGGS